MLEKLENESLQYIRARKDQIHWIKIGKECLIQGKYFDVWKINYLEKDVILIGLYDKQEDELSQMVENQLNHQPPSPHPSQLLKCISSDDKNTWNDWSLLAITILTEQWKPDQSTFTLTGYSFLFSPPPEV